MKIELKILKKENIDKTKNFKNVKAIAEKLCAFMDSPSINKKIRDKHKTGASSKEIQDIIIKEAEELGFKSEKKGLFNHYITHGLRPDYFNSKHSGILMEVERGKTTINNMDLLDIWKCHICKDANYLFLIVPMVRQPKEGNDRQEFSKVVNRVSSFYDKENYINIDGVFIFGY